MDWTPGEARLLQLPPRASAYEAFDAPLAELDSAAGPRIGSMYGRMKDRDWVKTGPALVAVRGDRTGATVRAEVTFPLEDPPTDAADVGMAAGTLPGGDCAAVVHLGNRGSLADTDRKLDQWIVDQGKQPRGDLRWYEFLNRPDQVGEDQLRTLIVQPVQ